MSDSNPNGRRGGRVAAAAWARVDLRSRWRSLVVLGLLAGLTGGFALAALSGARRSESLGIRDEHLEFVVARTGLSLPRRHGEPAE